MSEQPARVLQYGELRARGWTDSEIKAALRKGVWIRIVKGTYLDTSVAADPVALVRAIARRSPEFVVSHRSAARLHGLPLTSRGATSVEVTHPQRGPGRRQPHRVVRSGRLAPDEITLVDGVRVTTIARTLVDLARTETFTSAVTVADHVLHHRSADDDEILEALRRQHHVRGMPAARRALAFADGRAESPGESLLRVAFHCAGVEPPELQIRLLDDGGRLLARTDAGHPEDNAFYEYDGLVKYRDPYGGSGAQALFAEKKREDLVRFQSRALGRFTRGDVDDLTRVRERTERTRAVGRRLLASGEVRGRVVLTPPRTLAIEPW